MRKLQEPIDKLEMDIISQIFSKYISQVLHIHTNLWVKHIRNLMSASALLYADIRRLHIHNYYSFEKNIERWSTLGPVVDRRKMSPCVSVIVVIFTLFVFLNICD